MNAEKQQLKAELDTVLKDIYHAMKEKGYDPSRQLAGYILSEDPVYMPNWNNARGLIRSIDRDDLLHLIVEYYLENNFSDNSKDD